MTADNHSSTGRPGPGWAPNILLVLSNPEKGPLPPEETVLFYQPHIYLMVRDLLMKQMDKMGQQVPDTKTLEEVMDNPPQGLVDKIYKAANNPDAYSVEEAMDNGPMPEPAEDPYADPDLPPKIARRLFGGPQHLN